MNREEARLSVIGAISMALKDPILQQGFEIICKNLKDLEKENAELKENYFYARCIRSNCPYIHKENRNCTKFGGFFTAVSNGNCPMMQNLNSSIQLTKAKEILEHLLLSQPTPSSMYEETDLIAWRESIKEAGQFLSEVEK